ncbi:hypothetical protein [Sphingopyxis sp. LK2115]|jgi:hypothetical protein|uniref:hypothetical protein n=1 Tax=Sphingopyxis sp. LK2115 TaxID=2744558 RepID=UPI001660209F|nr:hypothetical protein [Sphingopyxis sp. LK2115]
MAISREDTGRAADENADRASIGATRHTGRLRRQNIVRTRSLRPSSGFFASPRLVTKRALTFT